MYIYIYARSKRLFVGLIIHLRYCRRRPVPGNLFTYIKGGIRICHGNGVVKTGWEGRKRNRPYRDYVIYRYRSKARNKPTINVSASIVSLAS